MATKTTRTSDALKILQRRYYEGRTERLAALETERLNAKIARDIFELRIAAGLSQRQLAELVGTTASVICRLEDSDYEGHSLSMLQRIASALEKRVEIRFRPRSAVEHRNQRTVTASRKGASKKKVAH